MKTLPRIIYKKQYAGVLAFMLVILLVPAPAFAQNKTYRLIHQGNTKFRQNNMYDAASYYLKALKVSPNNMRATFNLADVYLAKGDVRAADSLYNRVTQMEPNKTIRAMAWHNRGVISQTAALKDREKQQQLLRTAIEQYKQALRLVPQDNDTRYNLALCQKQLKESEQQQQKQQQQKKQQQQQKEKEKEKEKQQQQQKQQQAQSQQANNDEIKQTEQYINLAKQAEKRALQKVNQSKPRQKTLDKNW